MFDFFRKRRQREVRAACEAELERVGKMNAGLVAPRDLQSLAGLLDRARAAGLRDELTIKRVDFLHRLLSGLAKEIQDHEIGAFLAEARTLEIEETDGVRRLQDHLRMTGLKARGPEVIACDARGRAVYLQCDAEHNNKPGRFEVREDGVSFAGEVVIEIPWSRVDHVAQTTHAYRGYEQDGVIGIQEGKRRTATKFVLSARERAFGFELTKQVWERFKVRPPTE